MARRRRRNYREYVAIPGLGELPFMGKSVNSTDVLIGAGAGVIGSGAVKFALSKIPFQIPAALAPIMPVLTSAAVGAALYYGQKKSSKGVAHFTGAVAAGTAIALMDFAKAQAPQYFGDVVSLKLGNYGRGYGLLIDENPRAEMRALNGYNGLIIDDTPRNLAGLAAASMAPDDDGMQDLVDMDY